MLNLTPDAIDRRGLNAVRARAAFVLVAIVASLVLLFSSLWAPRVELKLEPGTMDPELGLAYVAPLRSRFPFRYAADGPDGTASNLELREDGRLLGPAHSQHADIRAKGGGRFSHWIDSLYFSASDGTDPRTNGRGYTVTVGARLSFVVWGAVFLADVLAILSLRRRLLQLIVSRGRAITRATHAVISSESNETERKTMGPTRAHALLLFAALAASLALLFSPLWAPRIELKLEPSAVVHNLGLAYVTPLRIDSRFPFHYAADGPDGIASNLELREDGRLLGPAHSQHADIGSKGGGRFSHWNDWLYFSSSDGTDPRANGRGYTASVSARVSAVIWASVLLADILIVFSLRRWLLAVLASHRTAFATSAMLAAISVATMLAAGLFGVVNPTRSPPKDFSLVLAIVGHVVLGCALTLAQWSMGAGIARALLPKTGTSYAQILLMGFPLSLALLALLTALALLVPYGRLAVALVWASSLWPLVRWPIDRAPLQSLRRVLPGLLVLSFVFGCWMALQWHGPTAIIPGSPSTDQVFYSSAVWGLAANPIGWPNLGNEGETYPYFNFLFPAIGAALVPILPLDSFLFICSSAVFAVLGSGLAVHAYLTERPPLRIVSLEAVVLVLALVAAGRTPSWIVMSPPAAFVVPLTVAVWFWTVRGRQSRVAASVALASSIAGSALSKVLSVGTLSPLALAVLLPHLRRMSWILQVVVVFLAAAGALYAASVLARFLPSIVGMTSIGPRSYELIVEWGVSGVWPFVAQDMSILLMIILAFRLMNWREAAAVTFGLILVLVYPFLTMVNFMCAAVVLALAAIDEAADLRRSGWLVIAAFLLASPAMILTDEAGISTGLFWLVIMAAVAFVTIDARRPAIGLTHLGGRCALVVTTILTVSVLALLASARGTLVLSSGWPGGADLTPQVRDIWQAVRERVPANALVFTDQTGRDPGLLEGWNTYVLNGQRQVFISSWAYSWQLAANPTEREARLQMNDKVLSGQLDPTHVRTSRQYGLFFAVVSAGRKLSPRWHKIYANRDHALYRWDP
jgi:hypothetical protein